MEKMNYNKAYQVLLKTITSTIICALVMFTCTSENDLSSEPQLFIEHSADETGIDFINQLEHTAEFNMYTYRNFYNGAGVGIGDINNDGLADVFFCGNLVDNKLYLNKGDFQFEDITEQAGVASQNVWSTGVSFADVNGDGWLDIYVCKSGKPGGERRYNELFINNGDLTFSEQAKAFGIADEGFSSHAAFFDYDKDGDLDCYLLNNSFRPVGNYDMRPGLREIRDTLGGNKLYRNDGDSFTDVSEQAGIYGSEIGFGLGVSIGDVDRDGWQDIFVSNDFFERDYLYINQKDGTFREELTDWMGEISMGSMGADIADINNDGLPEIFVTEMLPRSEARYKTKMTFENWDKYQLNVKNGYHHQFTRNALHLNNQQGYFSEISRMSNVHATDWSWGALMADFDNDGAKDIYVANGIHKDLMDQDYINYDSNNPEILQALRNRNPQGILDLIDQLPSERIPNFAFKNVGNLSFQDVSKDWGLSTPSHSNGSAYGDLDNDGDLDLLVNNINMRPFVYENKATAQPGANFLQFQLVGEDKNSKAIGTQITIYSDQQQFYQELAPMRGFLSCVDYKMHFGLGDLEQIDRVEVLWPNGNKTILENVPVNQVLSLNQQDASAASTEASGPAQNKIEQTELSGLRFKHQESDFIDFDRDRLLFQVVSADGPQMAKADVNGDGLSDVYICGAAGQAAQLFLQQNDGRFTPSPQQAFVKDQLSEGVDALFFDADQDGDQDLYVCNGTNEYSMISGSQFDHLYLNDGQGDFSKSNQQLPINKPESTSCVRASDFDQDGDLDLVVGTRLKPSVYGVAVNTYLLLNDGQGNFSNATASLAPELEQIGMVTDLQWIDIDNDQDDDLVAIGEWMPISVFENKNGKLVLKPSKQLDKSNGFWNTLEVADLDQDGDLDLLIGNHGLNSRLKASKDKPLGLLVNDFDDNRTAEQILTMYNGDKSYPLALRHDLVMQLPSLKKDYLYYKDYKEKTVEDIFDDKKVRTAAKAYIYETQSAIAINDGTGSFTLKALPKEAQMTPIHAILVDDFNSDGKLDILLGGNFYRSKPEIGIYDASRGLLLLGDGQLNFASSSDHQIEVKGEIRDFLKIQVAGESIYLVARNNDYLLALKRS